VCYQLEGGGNVLLTNDHKLSAATIAAIYKQRWQIELFFETMKQN
jgi:IS4 transposase